jgi:isopenicillin-N epimerase
MAANHQLALEGRDLVAAALDVPPPVPDTMLGSMASLPVPGLVSDQDATAFRDRLEAEERIQVPVGGWPVPAARTREQPEQVLLRISAQRYNELADYERLADALARRLGGRSARG